VSNQDRQPLRELNTDRQRIRQQNALQPTQGRINMPQEVAQIIRKQNNRRHAERRAEMGRKNASKPEKLMQDIKEHQERGVHSDCWAIIPQYNIHTYT
jgi:hypothetical protein